MSGIALFVAIQLLLLVAIESVWPEPRDPLFGRKLRQLQLLLTDSSPRTPLVLLLGSSRVFNGIDPNTLELKLAAAIGRPATVYNFGVSAAGPLAEMIVLNRLLAADIKPDLVLVEVFPAMLAEHRPLLEADALTVSRLWHRDLDLLARCDASFARVAAEWWRGALIPCHTYRFGLLGKLSTAWLPAAGWGTAYAPIDAKGWQGIDEHHCPSPNQPGALLVARNKYRVALTACQLGPGALALEQTLALCDREGVRAAILVMPEGTEFQRWYSPSTRALVDDWLDHLASDYLAPVIDARGWMADNEFFDSHHLLTGGAVRFAGKLSERATALVQSGAASTAAAHSSLRR